jgi:hypothetical protein
MEVSLQGAKIDGRQSGLCVSTAVVAARMRRARFGAVSEHTRNVM